MKKLLSGKLKLMNGPNGGCRTMAVNKSVRIVEHELLLPTNISLNTAATIWHILSIITAQKFLLDIDNKLKIIKNNIE